MLAVKKKKAIFVEYKSFNLLCLYDKDNNLEDLYFENSEYIDGNIYMGIVTEVLAGINSVFVNIGEEKRGLINVGTPTKLKRLKVGTRLLVQVTRMPIAEKGPKLTTQITISSRYFVLVLGTNKLSVSKKIKTEKEQKRLLDIMNKYQSDEYGIIARTFAKRVGKASLEKDLKNLLKRLRKIQKLYKDTRLPGLIYRKDDLLNTFMKEYYDREYSIIVSKKEDIKSLKDFARFYNLKIDLSYDKDALYSFGIESNIKKLLQKTVWLKSGAYLYIEKTEAMTVIDINSGKNVGKQHKNALYEINKESAKEIVKQIKLRKIGGIIVIDFIDIKHTRDKDKILDILRKGFKHDKVNTTVLGMSSLGLIEISRQKKAYSLIEAFTKECPKCEGLGYCLQ